MVVVRILCWLSGDTIEAEKFSALWGSIKLLTEGPARKKKNVSVTRVGNISDSRW
jgi:hypothetical protein